MSDGWGILTQTAILFTSHSQVFQNSYNAYIKLARADIQVWKTFISMPSSLMCQANKRKINGRGRNSV